MADRYPDESCFYCYANRAGRNTKRKQLAGSGQSNALYHDNLEYNLDDNVCSCGPNRPCRDTACMYGTLK